MGGKKSGHTGGTGVGRQRSLVIYVPPILSSVIGVLLLLLAPLQILTSVQIPVDPIHAYSFVPIFSINSAVFVPFFRIRPALTSLQISGPVTPAVPLSRSFLQFSSAPMPRPPAVSNIRRTNRNKRRSVIIGGCWFRVSGIFGVLP